MSKPQTEFYEKPIFTIINYIYWFFMSNLYFLILNFPLIFVIMAAPSNRINALPAGYIIAVFICFIPIGPALTALFSLMGKLSREKDINVTRDFFKAYKINFKPPLILWTLEMTIIVSLFIDVKLLASLHMPKIISFLMYLLIAMIISIGLHAFPILSRFNMKYKDIVRTAGYYTFKKLNNTVLNLAVIIVVGFAFIKISTFIFLFSSSISCFLIMHFEQKILLEIEKDLISEPI